MISVTYMGHQTRLGPGALSPPWPPKMPKMPKMPYPARGASSVLKGHLRASKTNMGHQAPILAMLATYSPASTVGEYDEYVASMARYYPPTITRQEGLANNQSAQSSGVGAWKQGFLANIMCWRITPLRSRQNKAAHIRHRNHRKHSESPISVISVTPSVRGR